MLTAAVCGDIFASPTADDDIALGQDVKKRGLAGDRTMIDALEPALEPLAKNEATGAAALQTRHGTEQNKRITHTKFGRSSYR